MDSNINRKTPAARANNLQAAVSDTGLAAPFIARPRDVLDNPALSAEQKRSILASWVSDKCAVEDAPRWRQLENGAFVDTQDIGKRFTPSTMRK